MEAPQQSEAAEGRKLALIGTQVAGALPQAVLTGALFAPVNPLIATPILVAQDVAIQNTALSAALAAAEDLDGE